MSCGIWVAPVCCPKPPEFEPVAAGVLLSRHGAAATAAMAQSTPHGAASVADLLGVDALFVRDMVGVFRTACRVVCSAVAKELEGENAIAAGVPVDT